MSLCKGCGVSVRLKPSALPLDYAPGTAAYVSTEEYEKRLAACAGCQALEYGTTCRFCGCFVQYRALFRKKACPDPGGDRWR